jgi:hypothetical protein
VDIQLNAHPSVLLPEPFARLLGVLARLLQPSLVDTQPDLLRHELRKVDGEAVGVIELPDVLAREGLWAGVEGGFRVGREETLASVQGSGKGDFFLVEEVVEGGRVGFELGEEFALR